MNIKLKKWKLEYINDIHRYGNNKKIADNLRNAYPYPYPYTYENAKEYVISCIENDEKRQCCRAIVVDNVAVGSIGIFLKDDVNQKSGEIGYWLGESFWGNDIMTYAIKEICNFVFNNYDIIRIFAEPYAYNKGSCKVLEKSGFILEGTLRNSVYKNGNVYDSYIYGLLK